MSRAMQNAGTSTVASTETTQVDFVGLNTIEELAVLQHISLLQKHHQWRPHLTVPKSPTLQTSLRARRPKKTGTQELDKEQLEKIPKFRARPPNRKIFQSKWGIDIFCNLKKQFTVPRHDKPLIPRITTPNPFHLQTEERGVEKEKRIAMELMHKQLEEEMARIPRAHPYPYTTDYPAIPPKPEPKPCTKPEPFQLESLVRHEEEIKREMEERRRMEMEEAQMRLFKARPILKEDPIPAPDKTRKPLTAVHEFNLQVDRRAVDRAEFDKKIKEKEFIYKRYRDEAQSATARMMEEEKALKQLHTTLVRHATPVPKFDNAFLPHKCLREVTKCKSPKLLVERRRIEKRMVVYPLAPTSSTASQMRR